MNQDALGKQGRRVHKDGELEVWAKQMQDGGRAVILLNRGTSDKDIAVSWQGDRLPRASECGGTRSVAGERFGGVQGKFSASVPPHTAVMVRVRQSVERARKQGSSASLAMKDFGLGETDWGGWSWPCRNLSWQFFCC